MVLVQHCCDLAVTIGTTFQSFAGPTMKNRTDPEIEWVLQPGSKQGRRRLCFVYGSSTVMVYSAGNGVHGFTLDPSMGSYILTHENIRMPTQGVCTIRCRAKHAAAKVPEPDVRNICCHAEQG